MCCQFVGWLWFALLTGFLRQWLFFLRLLSVSTQDGVEPSLWVKCCSDRPEKWKRHFLSQKEPQETSLLVNTFFCLFHQLQILLNWMWPLSRGCISRRCIPISHKYLLILILFYLGNTCNLISQNSLLPLGDRDFLKKIYLFIYFKIKHI